MIGRHMKEDIVCKTVYNRLACVFGTIITRWFKYDRDCNRLVYTQISSGHI